MEKAIGASNGYIHNLEVTGGVPSAAKLDKIAKHFNVSTDFLLGKTEIPSPKAPNKGVTIPVLGRVAAGIPITAIENIIGTEEITDKMASSGEYFALKIKGDSMSPYIMNNDIVIVRQQDDADSDQIVIALINGNDGCCKKIRKTKNALMLISMNQAYEPMIFTPDEAEDIPVQIIGKVVEIRRSV